MQEIEEYNNIYLDRFSLKKIMICSLILIFVIVMILKNIDYEKYYVNNAKVSDNNILKVLIDKNDLSIFNKYNKIKIENKFFAYTIISINEIEYLNGNYIELLLKIELGEKYNISNNYINFKILLKKENVLQYIFNKIGE